MIDFANNIISSDKGLDFDNYEDISEKLTELSIEQALLLIKKILKVSVSNMIILLVREVLLQTKKLKM